ncbi:MAG: outer membrane beta-barrel protein [Brumimicrobium sp.]|nr:outer membrane beta-barrel protein [Brumimicrobium sp.]
MPLRLIIIFIFTLSGWAFSQNMKFTGVVNDTINDKPLENAVVMAVRLSDGVLLGFTRTKEDGSFSLTSVPIDTMELVVTHPNFDDKRYYIIGSKENNEIHIPNIILPEQATEYEEVVVYANKEPIYFRGDTLVYVADSFATKENAMVEDLLKNLPGLQVDEDGNISSQGRKVTKVLVDGDEFFGEDPTIATRNLQADGVETIEVYETEDETSGGNSEEKIQVLDVRLKEDAKKGYFGKVAAAGGGNSELFTNEPGSKAFYESELLGNYFDKDLKLSVFALGSNTPNTGFSYRDASRFGLTNEMGGGWRSQFMGGRQLQGIPENYKGGFYYSDKIGKKKKLEIGLNYTYNDSRLTTDEETNSEYFLTDTTYTTFATNFKDQRQAAHTTNFTMEYQLDSLTELKLKSNLILREESVDEMNSTSFLSAAGNLTNATDVKNKSEAEGLEGNIDVELERKFKKRNRELFAQYQYGYTEQDRENFMQSNILFYAFPIPDSTFDQKREIINKTAGHRGLFEFTEPLSRKVKLKFQYKLDYFTGRQSNLTYDASNGEYVDLSTLYSNDFSNTRMENRLGASFIYTDRKHSLDVGTRVRNVSIDNENNFTGDIIVQDVDNILPYLEYTYKFSNSQRLRFSYTTSSSQPSLNQLQPVRDNTNPNNIVIGNPDLIPNYTHSMNLFYNKWNAIEQSYIWTNSYVSYTNDAFSNNITYLPDGRTISQAINVDNNIFAGVYAGGGLPIFDKKLRLDPNINMDYSRFNSMINDQMNTTENLGMGGSLSVGLRSDTMEISIKASYNYNIPNSSLSSGANQPYSVQSYSASVFFELPARFFIESDASYTINSQRAQGFNISPFIWNAKLNRRFLKTGNLVLNVCAYDLLNQNIGIQRSISNNVIIDNRNQIIARYFMLGMTLRFNNNKTKVDDGKHWF